MCRFISACLCRSLAKMLELNGAALFCVVFLLPIPLLFACDRQLRLDEKVDLSPQRVIYLLVAVGQGFFSVLPPVCTNDGVLK